MKALIDLLGGGLLGGLDNLVKTIFGSREQRDASAHDEQAAVMGAFAAEFNARSNRTIWDSLVDGLNRLPRPIMTFGVIGVFVYCVEDPEGFSVAMKALALMPEPGWILIGVIMAFWFGGKFLGKDLRRPEPIDPAAVREVVQLQRELDQERAPAVSRDAADEPPPPWSTGNDAAEARGSAPR